MTRKNQGVILSLSKEDERPENSRIPEPHNPHFTVIPGPA